MEINRTKKKSKFQLKFGHVYALGLLVVTLGLGLHVLNLLVLTPMRATGVLAHGYRMENIQQLEASWKNDTQAFGLTLSQVEAVSIFWNTGPVVFVSVSFESGASLGDARGVATEIIEYFIEVSDDAVLQYNIQVVISYGDVTNQLDENQVALTQHVHEYNHEFAEATLAHAEQHPSDFNVDRARRNINDLFTNSIVIVVDTDGLEAMRARLEAIEVAPGDDENDNVLRYPGIRQIPQSNLVDFPNWGTWDNARSRMIWNP